MKPMSYNAQAVLGYVLAVVVVAIICVLFAVYSPPQECLLNTHKAIVVERGERAYYIEFGRYPSVCWYRQQADRERRAAEYDASRRAR